MCAEEASDANAVTANPFTAADVAAILRDRGWVSSEFSPEQNVWCERAASMLGPHVADRGRLADLLGLVFHYDATELMTRVETHVVMSRYAARDVVRRLALLLLDGDAFTSDRFTEVVSALKQDLELRGRELFHPIRLALAGQAGEGALDRVILLVDEAAVLPFDPQVKPARQRILEFCAALD